MFRGKKLFEVKGCAETGFIVKERQKHTLMCLSVIRLDWALQSECPQQSLINSKCPCDVSLREDSHLQSLSSQYSLHDDSFPPAIPFLQNNI